MADVSCTLVVSSCDAYSDLWDSFFFLLKKYWPDLPYNIVVSTESLPYETSPIPLQALHPKTQGLSWARRLRDVLHQIESPYVILILDDFFLYDFVCTDRVAQCLQWLKEDEGIATFTFWPTLSDGIEGDYPGFELRPQKSKYKVAAILGMWNKQKLMSYLDYDENAWQWEVNATKRSFASDDKFYIMQDKKPYIFPYNFVEYGLFSGKWLKKTVQLFSDNDISFDFSKRGFYDEAERGNSPSIAATFEVDSAVVPYYALTHNGNPFLPVARPTGAGPFRQVYEIPGARGLVRWEPSSQWGFSIEGFEATITFESGKSTKVYEKNTFGNYASLNGKMVFTRPVPTVYIPSKKNRPIARLVIEGTSVCPVEKEVLQMAAAVMEKPIPKKHVRFYAGIWQEFLLSPEKTAHVILDSRLLPCFGEMFLEDQTQVPDRLVRSGEFSQGYHLENGVGAARWIPAQHGGFVLLDLDICWSGPDGDKHHVPLNEIKTDMRVVDNCFVCLNNGEYIEVRFPEGDTKELVISGQMQHPIPYALLHKALSANLSKP